MVNLILNLLPNWQSIINFLDKLTYVDQDLIKEFNQLSNLVFESHKSTLVMKESELLTKEELEDFTKISEILEKNLKEIENINRVEENRMRIESSTFISSIREEVESIIRERDNETSINEDIIRDMYFNIYQKECNDMVLVDLVFQTSLNKIMNNNVDFIYSKRFSEKSNILIKMLEYTKKIDNLIKMGDIDINCFREDKEYMEILKIVWSEPLKYLEEYYSFIQKCGNEKFLKSLKDSNLMFEDIKKMFKSCENFSFENIDE